MQFRTQIGLSRSTFPISYQSKIVSLGSCFAENMAAKFDYYRFQNICNPFGIVYHPLAIQKIIDFSVSGKVFSHSDIFFHNERWHCFDIHSDLSDNNPENLLSKLNGIVKEFQTIFLEATHIIITYGTAWVYRNIESDAIVANCHKVPQKHFRKELLSVKSIEKSIAETIGLIKSINKKAEIIFTISPVRHIKDGFVENQWSKSNLFSGLHEIVKKSEPALAADYFPSYEILMDELRDYRFYTADMLHPNQMAIDYIWERFVESTVSETALPIMEEVESVQKGLLHRPFNPESESHEKFQNKLKAKINALVTRYPYMEF